MRFDSAANISLLGPERLPRRHQCVSARPYLFNFSSHSSRIVCKAMRRSTQLPKLFSRQKSSVPTSAIVFGGEWALRLETGGQFFEAFGIKALAGIRCGLRKRGDGNAAVFVVVDCILRTRHDLFSSHVSLVRCSWPQRTRRASKPNGAGDGVLCGCRECRWLGGNAPEDHGSGLLDGF